MPGRKGALLGRVVELMEFPGDVVLNLPRLIMIGNAQMTVENHRGLVRYDPASITIGVGAYQLVIEGENLVIGTVDTETVTIRGTISRVSFEV